jgi:hypothetical protein
MCSNLATRKPSPLLLVLLLKAHISAALLELVFRADDTVVNITRKCTKALEFDTVFWHMQLTKLPIWLCQD